MYLCIMFLIRFLGFELDFDDMDLYMITIWFSVGGGVKNLMQLNLMRTEGVLRGKKANIRDRQGGEHIPHASDVAVQSLKS